MECSSLVHQNHPTSSRAFRLPTLVKRSLSYSDVTSQMRIAMATLLHFGITTRILHDPLWIVAVLARVTTDNAPMTTAKAIAHWWLATKHVSGMEPSYEDWPASFDF